MHTSLKLFSIITIATTVVSANAASTRTNLIAVDRQSTTPLMISYKKTHHKHVYYGIGGSKHQTATGGPVGGITSRN